MATQADLDEVRRLIASGVENAAHTDKRFSFRSLDDLERIERKLSAALATVRPVNHSLARHRRGIE